MQFFEISMIPLGFPDLDADLRRKVARLRAVECIKG